MTGAKRWLMVCMLAGLCSCDERDLKRALLGVRVAENMASATVETLAAVDKISAEDAAAARKILKLSTAATTQALAVADSSAASDPETKTKVKAEYEPVSAAAAGSSSVVATIIQLIIQAITLVLMLVA